MTYDRRAIMKAAWTIARRFAGNRETWGQRLSRALKCAWDHAKTAQRIACASAVRVVERASTARPADLRAEIIALENTDRLGWAGLQRLSFLRAAQASIAVTAADLAA